MADGYSTINDNLRMGDPAPILSILHRIAVSYKPDSSEYAALEMAARAVIFTFHEKISHKFQYFLDECNKTSYSTKL